MKMVVVTGLSGTGRSAALKGFEDIGFYCVDNLPLALLPAFVEYARGSSDAARFAIGIDIREKTFPQRFPVLYEELKKTGDFVEMIFLEASDQTIIRRFSETRRPHPLAANEIPLPDAINKERSALAEVKKLADKIIDTTDYTVHDLRQAIERRYADAEGRPMVITLVTFGYKYGIPFEVDLLFDLRFLSNPHFVPSLRPHTGEHPAVKEYIMSRPGANEFLERLCGFLEYLLPRYRNEGKSYLTIGLGCTGGKHRSVAFARLIADRFRSNGYDVHIKHRDMGITCT